MIILEDVGCSPSKESKMFFSVFKAFEEQRTLEMGKNIKCLRIKNGGEFYSQEFDAFYNQEGI